MYNSKLHSRFLFNLLNCSKQVKVHSIFKSTLNVEIDDQLVSIHSADSKMGPMSIKLFENVDFTKLHLQVNEKGIFQHHLLIFDTFTIDLTNSRVQSYCEFNSRVNEELFAQTINRIFDLIPNMEFPGSLVDYKSTYYKQTRDALVQQEGNYISDTIGMGIGLTPSFDDFLVGVLFGLEIQKNISAISYLKDLISNEDLYKTTDIARFYLGHALQSEYSELFTSINIHLKEENVEELFHDFLELLKHGSTSGVDTFYGIHLTMNLLNNWEGTC